MEEDGWLAVLNGMAEVRELDERPKVPRMDWCQREHAMREYTKIEHGWCTPGESGRSGSTHI